MSGTLYGVGVGPGDPKLLTLRALEILKTVEVVLAAGSAKNEYSLALNTAALYMRPETETIRLDFPMTSDQDVLERAWRANAARTLEVLQSGRDAAFVTIGDPLTYSTYGYLLKTIRARAPEVAVETVPGVTAYNAAAARLNIPLVESRQSLLLVSGVSDPKDIPRLAGCADTLVIMKAYRNFDRILDALEGLPEPRRVHAVTACGLEGERIVEDAFAMRGEKTPYLTLMIVKDSPED